MLGSLSTSDHAYHVRVLSVVLSGFGVHGVVRLRIGSRFWASGFGGLLLVGDLCSSED